MSRFMQRQAWLFVGAWQGTLSVVGLHGALHTTARCLFCWADNSTGGYPHCPVLFRFHHTLKCSCCHTALSVPPLSFNNEGDKKSLPSFLSFYFDPDSAANLAPNSKSWSNSHLLYFTHKFPLKKMQSRTNHKARCCKIMLKSHVGWAYRIGLRFWYLWCFDLRL